MARDYELLGSEILRALRGTRSQTAFNRRLGFASNVAYTWESGRRFPTAAELVRVASVLGIDLAAGWSAFVGLRIASDADWSDPAVLGRQLDRLRGGTSVAAVARRADRHRGAVARWLSGTAVPRLPDLLRLADAITDRVLDLVAVLVDPATVPSVADEWGRLQAARALAGATPWTAAVWLAFELDGPATRTTEWLALRLGLPASLVDECLDRLVAAGQVRRRGPGWERVDAVPTVDTRQAASLRSFWADVARRRLDDGAPGLLAWNLGAVSEADYARIMELQRRAFRELRAIVAGSDGADRIVLVSWALTSLG